MKLFQSHSFWLLNPYYYPINLLYLFEMLIQFFPYDGPLTTVTQVGCFASSKTRFNQSFSSGHAFTKSGIWQLFYLCSDVDRVLYCQLFCTFPFYFDIGIFINTFLYRYCFYSMKTINACIYRLLN